MAKTASTMEDIKRAIEEKSAKLEGYAWVLERLLDAERWNQHRESNEEDAPFVDDDSDWARTRLSAVRETMEAVRKLAGV